MPIRPTIPTWALPRKSVDNAAASSKDGAEKNIDSAEKDSDSSKKGSDSVSKDSLKKDPQEEVVG